MNDSKVNRQTGVRHRRNAAVGSTGGWPSRCRSRAHPDHQIQLSSSGVDAPTVVHSEQRQDDVAQVEADPDSSAVAEVLEAGAANGIRKISADDLPGVVDPNPVRRDVPKVSHCAIVESNAANRHRLDLEDRKVVLRAGGEARVAAKLPLQITAHSVPSPHP